MFHGFYSVLELHIQQRFKTDIIYVDEGRIEPGRVYHKSFPVEGIKFWGAGQA